MHRPSVERTFRNLLYVYGRGRRRCGDPTILSDRFPLVGGKRGRMPCGRATEINTGIIKSTPHEFRFTLNGGLRISPECGSDILAPLPAVIIYNV